MSAPRFFVEAPGVEFNPTYIDFLIEQPSGTEIRADIEGIYNRGYWEGIEGAEGIEVNRNPINFFINMIFFIMAKAGTDASVWDVPSVEAVLNKFYAIIPDSSSSVGLAPFLCDGALTSSMTGREFLAQFCVSFQVDILQKRNGKLALEYVDETDEDRPVFTDGQHILRDTFFENLAKPTVNQCTYRYARNYATSEWAAKEVYDNEDDQLTLGYTDPLTLERVKKIENDTLDLFWVRDPLTALYVTARRLSFLALGSFRPEWQMPAPEVMNDVELAKLVGITHWAGADLGGYANKEVKIIGLTLDLDKLIYMVKGILRIPQGIVIPIPDPDPISLLVHAITPHSATFNDLTQTTPSLDTTGVKLLVVWLVSATSNLNTPVLTDSKGNTWTLRSSYAHNSRTQIAYCINPIVGSGHTFTATIVGTFGRPGLCVMGFSGAFIGIDQASSYFQSASGIQPGAITPTTNGQLIICGYSVNATGTSDLAVDSGMAITDINVPLELWDEGMAFSYKVQGAAAVINPAWTWSGGNAASQAEIVSFFPYAPQVQLYADTFSSYGSGVALPNPPWKHNSINTGNWSKEVILGIPVVQFNTGGNPGTSSATLGFVDTYPGWDTTEYGVYSSAIYRGVGPIGYVEGGVAIGVAEALSTGTDTIVWHVNTGMLRRQNSSGGTDMASGIPGPAEGDRVTIAMLLVSMVWVVRCYINDVQVAQADWIDTGHTEPKRVGFYAHRISTVSGGTIAFSDWHGGLAG
jgi:hypothetical protein